MISPLAKATFKAFKPWINTSDCGIKGENGICHLITKETKRLFSEYRRLRETGEKRPKLNYPRGSNRYKYGPFDPKRDFFCKTMSPWRIDQHLGGTKHYYSSNQHGRSLLMVDIDWHKKWQKVRKEEQSRAINLITQHFPTGLHVPSERGHHVYLKVNYYTIEEINKLITSFQTMLRNLFLTNEIILDVEVKGSVTSDKSGSLAQLPCRSDWWSWERLAEFENCKPINSLQLQGNVNRIEGQLSPEVIRKTKVIKAGIEQQWSEQEELLGEYAHLEFSKQELNLEATIVKPQIKKPVFQPEPENLISTFSYKVEDWHPEEPDAFERTRKVLLPFFRSFYKEYRREPSVKEGISYLNQNGLYSGAWEDGESERSRRVSNVLKFISASFDPKKLRSSTECNLNHGLIRWVNKHFPKGIKGSLQDKRVLDFLTQTCGENKFHVPMEFVVHFFQLLNLWQQTPDDNDGLATSFFKENWNRFDSCTYSAPSWNQDFFRVTREHFNSTGIVNIYDREHKAGKCWRWKKGGNYPQKYRTKKVGNVTGNGRWRYLNKKRNTTVQYLYGYEWVKNPFQSKTTFSEMISGRSPP